MSHSREAKLKETAVKNIRRYSHYRKKADIQQLVEEYFDDGKGHVLGKPISYYRLTHQGILLFSQGKNRHDDCTISESSDIDDLSN